MTLEDALARLESLGKDLSADELDRMVRSGRSAPIADWLNAYVVKGHPDK
jgi:hypothetical protein